MAYFENPLRVKNKAAFRRPHAELLTIGNELLTGSVLNTNAQYLGRELVTLGFDVRAQSAYGDDPISIHEALRLALSRSDVIVVSGGLGPTPDDITRDAISGYFRVPLVLSKVQLREIARRYRQRGRRVPEIVKREAYFPANAKPVFNRFGIALGFIIEEKGRVIMVVPGVPGELVRLFENHLKPFLKKKFPRLTPSASLVVKTIGLSEPTVMKRLGPSFFQMGKFQFGIYPETGEVALRIYADSRALLNRLKRRIVQALGRAIYSFSDESLPEVIGRRLRSLGATVGFAESCTGGEVSEAITRVPGASRYFLGAVVPYQNEIKRDLLGVPEGLIKIKGAVSRESALALARGIRRKFAATLGVAVTGIAGPTGGTPTKPVGLVYIAISSAERSQVWKEFFAGDRHQIQDRATKKVLEHLWQWIQP